MRNTIIFGGKDLGDFNCYCTGSGIMVSPALYRDTYEVPGRHGLLHGMNVRLSEVTIEYPCFIAPNFEENFRALKNYILSLSQTGGLITLRDSYQGDRWRWAVYADAIEPEVSDWRRAGTFTLRFSCQPQQYLDSGAVMRTFYETGTLNNPTMWRFEPYISAVLTNDNAGIVIGGLQIDIDEAPDGGLVEIRCDDMVAFGEDSGGAMQDWTSHISFTNYEGTGKMETWGGRVDFWNISQVGITPGWWEV